MLKYPLMGFVKLWRRLVSPAYGDVCKFHPSCSAYGLRALEVHGGVRGSWLLVRRLGRCHPWSMGGVDYVPNTPEAQQWASEDDSAPRRVKPENPAPEVAL